MQIQMAETLLVRYGELSLKSPAVRREFEGKLKGRILSSMLRAGIECTVTDDHGHLYIHSENSKTAIPVVRRVFGVVSVSPVSVIPTELDEISSKVVASASGLASGAKFAVRTRRTGTHKFTSHDVDVKLGADIIKAYPEKGLKVDLTHPEIEFEVEIRGKKTYVYTERQKGPGGFPLGVAGRIGAYVDGVRGALGAWLMMKRGCEAIVVSSESGASDTAILRFFDSHIDPSRVVPQEKAWDALKELVEKYKLSAVSLPIGVEGYQAARDYFGDTVVFSPTVGMSDAEVMKRWEEVTDLTR